MAGDIQVVAEIDDKKFLDGLDRMKAQVASYQAQNIRAEADAIDRRTALQQRGFAAESAMLGARVAAQAGGRAGMGLRAAADAASMAGLPGGRMLSFAARFGPTAAAAAAGLAAILGLRKGMKDYEEAVEKADGSTRGLSETIGRGTSVLVTGLIDWQRVEPVARRAAEGLSTLQIAMRTGFDFDAAGRVKETIIAVEKLREAARHAQAFKAVDTDQEIRAAELAGNRLRQATLRAEEAYRRSIDALRDNPALTMAQKYTAADREEGLRDRTVKRASDEERSARDSARADMQKLRRERAADEAEKVEARKKEERDQAARVQKNREALELEARRLDIAGLRAQGKDKEAEAARIQLEYEQRMKDLEESGLGALERGAFGDRFARARDTELAEVGRERRRRPSAQVVVEGGNSSILAQAYGGSGIDKGTGKEQVTEAKKHTEILKSIDRKVGEPQVAVLG